MEVSSSRRSDVSCIKQVFMLVCLYTIAFADLPPHKNAEISCSTCDPNHGMSDDIFRMVVK